jgi:adenylate cyclase
MRRIILAIGITLLSVLTLVRGSDPLPVQALREIYFDYMQRLNPRDYVQMPVRVVDVDENSLAAFGQWPWPRDLLAQLVDNLNGYGAAVIVFDVLFHEPDRMSPSRLVSRLSESGVIIPKAGLDQLASMDTDTILARAIEGRNVILGVAQVAQSGLVPDAAKVGFVEIGSQPSLGLPFLSSSAPILPILVKSAAGVGTISVSPSGQTNLVRKAPLIWRSQVGMHPSLAVEALRLAMGESTVLLQGYPDLTGVTERIRIGGLEIPTLPDGQIWIRYRKDHPDLYVSAQDVLTKTDDPALHSALGGNIVLIGTSAAGLFDIRTTAIGENVAGVSIHAQIIEQILLEDYLMRDGLVVALEIITFVIIGLVILIVMTIAGPAISISSGAGLGLLVVAGSWIAFSNYGILFDATFPLIGGILTFSVPAAYQFIVVDRDKRLIRNSFSHYVAPTILAQIENSGHVLELGGINRTITVMFCDIRNFTPLSETMSASDLVGLLNGLFTALGAEILAERGTIDKFIGDAIMAFWNAPIEVENHRELASLAALGMRKALRDFNDHSGRPDIATAVGISTGTASVGNIGSKDRFNYSAIGNTVNVASRIETNCRHVCYDILMSEHTASGLQEMALLEAGHLDLKGRSERQPTFILIGDTDLANSKLFGELKIRHDKLVSALKDGEPDLDQLTADCLDLVAQIEPGLASFYGCIVGRADDFCYTNGKN